MDEGLIDIPQSKWGAGTGRQVILKGDFRSIEYAILQSFGLLAPPNIEWVDATSIKVPATSDDIAALMMIGFPSMLHKGLWIIGGLTDARYRENTAETILDFDLSTSRWGTEKASQWYIIYALAGETDLPFTIKAMPFMRFSSQASQVITLRNNLNSANIGYGFTTDELVDGKIYVFSGASKGLLRTIVANNNDNGTGGTITYSGDALTMTQGDWFVVLPPGTNFRWIGSIFNNSSEDITKFVKDGDGIEWLENVVVPAGGPGIVERIPMACPLAVKSTLASSTSLASLVGYPDAGAESIVINGALSSQRDAVEIGISLCKLYIQGTPNIRALRYSHPPGCGF